MKDRLFLDTNILVYLANEDSDFHNQVLKQFNRVSKKYALWISRQILREYAVVMSRNNMIERTLNSEEIVADLNKWQSFFNIADETEDISNNLIYLIKKYHISGKKIHDANVVASMITYKIQLLFTYNLSDFVRFKEIKLIEIEE